MSTQYAAWMFTVNALTVFMNHMWFINWLWLYSQDNLVLTPEPDKTTEERNLQAEISPFCFHIYIRYSIVTHTYPVWPGSHVHSFSCSRQLTVRNRKACHIWATASTHTQTSDMGSSASILGIVLLRADWVAEQHWSWLSQIWYARAHTLASSSSCPASARQKIRLNLSQTVQRCNSLTRCTVH